MISDRNIDIRMKLGKILKSMRENAGYNIKDFSEIANIERNGYSMIEKGERNVSVGILCKICTALNSTPAEIFKAKEFCREEKSENDKPKDIELSEEMLDKINMKKLGIVIKKNREKAGLSQQKFADANGFNRNEINRIENNRAQPNHDLIMRTCYLLNIDLEQFLEDFK
ncbi:XRE family transcriptional regulator [Erysipelotrichaceae bacterium AF15-26LB]|nr:helix-turn-helix domain-containing protein [[Clostridium] innocuum]RJV92441.1 XRE family transcriptional regulator [Erysipelotrichaceae bacterium AF15-26LB]RJV92690.1 XRE family transcriptional regulator [Erysipelotrichaceae bacterium AF19-24AC]